MCTEQTFTANVNREIPDGLQKSWIYFFICSSKCHSCPCFQNFIHWYCWCKCNCTQIEYSPYFSSKSSFSCFVRILSRDSHIFGHIISDLFYVQGWWCHHNLWKTVFKQTVEYHPQFSILCVCEVRLRTLVNLKIIFYQRQPCLSPPRSKTLLSRKCFRCSHSSSSCRQQKTFDLKSWLSVELNHNRWINETVCKQKTCTVNITICQTTVLSRDP